MTDEQRLAERLRDGLIGLERLAPVRPGLTERVLDRSHAPAAIGTRSLKRRARWVAPLGAALGVLAVAAALTVFAVDRHGAPPRQLRTVARTYAGLHLLVPAGWTAVSRDFVTGGVVQPLGYLTNEPTVRECRAKDGQVGCGAPVDRLRRGGIVVAVNELPLISFDANSKIAGLPAHTLQSPCRQDCLPGATNVVTVTVAAPLPHCLTRTVMAFK